MSKAFALALVVVSLGACASSQGPGNYSLQFSSTSSRLVFSKDLPSFPGNAPYFEIPGYIFVAGHISLHPGKHRIAYACPGQWEWRNMTHFIPAVEHTFEIGKWYELYCEEGYPHIRVLKKKNGA